MADVSKLKCEIVDAIPAVSSPEDKANALQLLERMDALDLAEMLGLTDGN
jgi:hypothetical protein